MPVLSAAELASLRSDLSALLPDLCTIKRDTKAKDGYGGETWTPADVATGVACLVHAVKARMSLRELSEVQIASKVFAVNFYDITFPYGTDVQLGDTVVITSLNNLTLRVESVNSPESWSVVLQTRGVETT